MLRIENKLLAIKGIIERINRTSKNTNIFYHPICNNTWELHIGVPYMHIDSLDDYNYSNFKLICL